MTVPDRDAWIAGYLAAATQWQDQHPCCQPDDHADAERAYAARFPSQFAGEDTPGNASPWGTLFGGAVVVKREPWTDEREAQLRAMYPGYTLVRIDDRTIDLRPDDLRRDP